MTVQSDNEKVLNQLLSEHFELSRAYLNNATVHAWFKQYLNGRCTLDEAFIGVIVRLTMENRQLFDEIIELKSRETRTK